MEILYYVMFCVTFCLNKFSQIGSQKFFKLLCGGAWRGRTRSAGIVVAS